MTLERQNSTILTQNPFSVFKELSPRLISHLEGKMGLLYQTKIQSKTIPVLLSGRDALIRSETGSGKTLAYAIPIVNSLSSLDINRSSGTLALILAPTRELSIQIFEVLKKVLSAFHWVVAGTLMGGERKKSEKARLRKGVNVLVATPGRLLDHLQNTESFDVSGLKWLVFDEADRLLDLGFESTLKRVLVLLKEKAKESVLERRNVLVSATLSTQIKKVIDITLNDPVFVTTSNESGENEEKDTANNNARIHPKFIGTKESNREKMELDIKAFEIPFRIEQFWVRVNPEQKLSILIAILIKFLKDVQKGKAIVFLSTCDEVEFISKMMERLEDFFKIATNRDLLLLKLHGDMGQKDRTAVFFKFLKSPNAILFCTDIAARGLDLPEIHLIVQYDAPINPVEYIHRIGRTARLDTKGKAIIILMPNEVGYLEILNNQKNKLIEMKTSAIFENFGRIVQPKKINAKKSKKVFQEEFLKNKINSVLGTDKKISAMAFSAYRKFVKAYATYPRALKHIFRPQTLDMNKLRKGFGIKSGLKIKETTNKRKISGSRYIKQPKRNNSNNGEFENDDFKRNGNDRKRVYDYGKIANKLGSSNEFGA